ncbi:hypothetical protein [Sanguibacter antarcticus]|uniref:Uncharacterized protein n=1 Tax=Sanguibacter antarcticus TaxID=372484 RepID=A0A2A9E2V0_9MICO|nr:hypothetical protein [Sanguibacter antarcticus]PFG33163.1 hypothetical protein ATL42_1023 [Sanguibacter antarcticus]
MSRTPRTDVGPSTHIHTGPTVPAWTLHAGLAVAAAGAVCAAAAGTTLDTSSLLLLLAGLLLAIAHAARRPTLVPTVAALVATGLACIVVLPAADTWRIPLIIVCVHALVRLSWFTSSSRPGGRIEVDVLRREGRTFLVLDLAGQAVGLLALALTELDADGRLGHSGALGIVGAVALFGLAVLVRGPRSRVA